MNESFLHYVWQFQYFNKQNLSTETGDAIQIIKTGSLNTNAGPDFMNARIRIGEMEWVGNVEIHINSSAWYEHKHDLDQAYENVVLHVVWKNDKPVKRNDQTLMPTLELKDRVDEKMLLNFRKLVNSPESIPCERNFARVSELIKLSMMERALVQRLQSKASIVLETWNRTINNWEETCYRLLAKNFGFKVNAEPFSQLAATLPYRILLKHSDKLVQIEALLFGQAGFLDKHYDDPYYKVLSREYSLLCNKYQLSDSKMNKAQWKFLRLRPANFPTVRLAQLASLLFHNKNLFSKILSATSFKAVYNLFTIRQSEYWTHHYQFSQHAKEGEAGLGDESIYNIIVNSVVPLLTAYGKFNDEQTFIDRSVEFLQQIPSEKNSITKKWNHLGMESKTSFDSQALIELYNNFCLKRRCLMCTIGSSLIKPVS